MPADATPIRLLLVDEHPLIRAGLRACFAAEADFEIVGEAVDGEAALRRARELTPDVVLLDLNLPRLDGIAVTARLRRLVPNTRILIVTMHDQREYLLQIVRAGAHGYLSKLASPEQLIAAVRQVLHGTVYPSDIAHAFVREHVRAAGARGSDALSARERQVLARVAEGRSNKEIARELGIAVRTVETHRERLMRKLDIHTVAGLTRYVLAQSLGRRPTGRRPRVRS